MVAILHEAAMSAYLVPEPATASRSPAGFGGAGHAEAQKAGSLIEAGKGSKETAHAPLRHYYSENCLKKSGRK